jgi:hypothetical protein
MLSVAYISGQTTAKVKAPSKKELLHNAAVATMARSRALDKIKAEKMFETELAELEALKLKLVGM